MYACMSTASTLFFVQAGADSIQEYDSLSSESSESSVPHTCRPSPPPQLHTSTPTHPMTIRDFPNLVYNPITTPTPEYMNIATPPSSPELTATTEQYKTTTSAWIKQIPLESEELAGAASNDTTHCLNDTALRTLGHSGGSGKRGRWGKGRVVPGGLAEAVEKVAQRESSEVTFWEHRTRQIQDSDIGIRILFMYVEKFPLPYNDCAYAYIHTCVFLLTQIYLPA